MKLSKSSLQLAVVGHTNTGKTSLLRTLTRNPNFGEVDNRPGTTRHVEHAYLLVDDNTVIDLYDTPGLEDSVSLLDYIENEVIPKGQRLDGPDQISRFLQKPASTDIFEQEARVLKTLLDCDAALYIIDSRDPVLSKFKDELTLLARCGHPIMPVLNFTRSPEHRLEEWREALARLGLHVSVEFDTVAPPLDGETMLYDKLSILVGQNADILRRMKENVIEQRRIRREDGYRIIAETAIDIAAWRTTAQEDDASIKEATRILRETIRNHEQRCVKALLELYRFDSKTFLQHNLPLEGERWEMDLFNPEALKEMGVHVSKGVAAGAMAGATIDALTAGISLGTGTIIGAAAGGLWQGADKWGKRLYNRFRGYQELSVDDGVMQVFLVRQTALLNALDRRGHAAIEPLVIQAEKNKPLPEVINKARSNPSWSTLSDNYAPGQGRNNAVRDLIKAIETSIE